MAYDLRFSIEDELKIYARLLDELMKKSSTINISSSSIIQSGVNPTTIIRSSEIEDHNMSSIFTPTLSGSSSIFDLAGSHSGWPQTRRLSNSTEVLFGTNENEIHETYDGSSMIRSSSFSTLD
jgi:hypothetical protein